MNFLQLLASGASIFSFNFQSIKAQTVQSINKPIQPHQGFKKVDQNLQNNAVAPDYSHEQAVLLKKILQNERQQLINRYLQLNLQLLEGKTPKKQQKHKSDHEQSFEDKNLDEYNNQDQSKNSCSKKKIKKLVKCGHDDKTHYAKGLCNNCYHKFGRTKKPWNCPHLKLYAAGMCQNCYINKYNRKKRQEIQLVDSIESKLPLDANLKENLIIPSQQQKPDCTFTKDHKAK